MILSVGEILPRWDLKLLPIEASETLRIFTPLGFEAHILHNYFGIYAELKFTPLGFENRKATLLYSIPLGGGWSYCLNDYFTLIGFEIYILPILT